MILVNCIRLLAEFPKTVILQHDGFHLSRMAQNLIGEATAQAIVADIGKETREASASFKYLGKGASTVLPTPERSDLMSTRKCEQM